MIGINISRTLFFHPLLLSGISPIIIFKIKNRLTLLKIKTLNLSEQLQIVRLMSIILVELNYLQDYELVELLEYKFRRTLQV